MNTVQTPSRKEPCSLRRNKPGVHLIIPMPGNSVQIHVEMVACRPVAGLVQDEVHGIQPHGMFTVSECNLTTTAAICEGTALSPLTSFSTCPQRPSHSSKQQTKCAVELDCSVDHSLQTIQFCLRGLNCYLQIVEISSRTLPPCNVRIARRYSPNPYILSRHIGIMNVIQRAVEVLLDHHNDPPQQSGVLVCDIASARLGAQARHLYPRPPQRTKPITPFLEACNTKSPRRTAELLEEARRKSGRLAIA